MGFRFVMLNLLYHFNAVLHGPVKFHDLGDHHGLNDVAFKF